jgi:predicted nucleotide-binding protein
MERGIKRLEKQIAEIEAFDVSVLTKRWDAPQMALQTAIEGTLVSVFGHKTVEYNRYEDAIRLDRGPLRMGSSWVEERGGYGMRNETHEAQQYVTQGKAQSVQILRQAVNWLRDEIEMHSPDQVATSPATESAPSRKIFIVHGHDTGVREAVARFVQKIGFEPIILHEQANQGRTVMEKVEAHGDVGFAIVLLTPDDEGNKIGESPKPRARQNVLLELGYFIGRLGRSNVCAFSTSSTMELPTDFAGVVWEAFDPNGAWKFILGRELKAAGFEIDGNKIIE